MLLMSSDQERAYSTAPGTRMGQAHDSDWETTEQSMKM